MFFASKPVTFFSWAVSSRSKLTTFTAYSAWVYYILLAGFVATQPKVLFSQEKSKDRQVTKTYSKQDISSSIENVIRSIDRNYLGTNHNHQQPKLPSVSIDFAAYTQDLRELPIGVFDSGIGGLTVLEAILACDLHNNRSGAPGADGIPDFANEKFIYLGDQANMPYGNYPEKGKEDFLRELILMDSLFLLGNRNWPNRDASSPEFAKQPVKAIVIACNTATAFGLDDLRKSLDRLQIPILTIGVVEAGATAVIEEVKQTKSPGAVAVLATMGTCNSGAYPRAISQTAGRQGILSPTVVQQGSLGLAGAIEGDPAFVFTSKSPISNSNAIVNANPVPYRGPAVDRAEATIDPTLANRYGFDMNDILGTTDDPKSWKLNSIENYIRYDVTTLVDRYRRESTATRKSSSNIEIKPIEYVMLGCTHFPFESDRIVEAFNRLRSYRDQAGNTPYRDLIAERVQLINPAQLTAKDLFRQLFLKRQLRAHSPLAPQTVADSGDSSSHQLFISVPHLENVRPDVLEEGWFKYDFKYGRMAGSFLSEDTKIVPLTQDLLPPTSRSLLIAYAPQVCKLLGIQTPESVSNP